MAAPDTIIIEGRAYSWRVLLELRRVQLDAWRKVKPSQPKLFDLKEDCRPKAEQSADGRYLEPSLLDAIHEAGG